MIKKFVQIGHSPNDSEDEKLKKSTLLIMAFPFGVAGLFWGVLYFINGLILPGSIPFGYGILSLISVFHFMVFKKFRFFRFSQILLILLLPFLLQISLGGFIPSSSVILWGLVSPLGALVFYNVKQSLYWFSAFVLLVVIAFIVNNYLPQYFDWNLSEKFIVALFIMNILGISCIIYIMQYYFVSKQSGLKKSVEQKNAEILQKNKEITDSINYARRIQSTLFANRELLEHNLHEYFVLFKPKDIVSGDFYWATNNSGRFYLAVCDSTGHGVPGAFMSLLNISFLNEAINERNIGQPNEICDYVREKLIANISQDGGQDGMDGVLVCIDREKKMMRYAAAHNAPVLIRENKVVPLEADRMPIGKGERNETFKHQEIDLRKGDMIYLYTDGYADQFGGLKGKKFKYKQMVELMLSVHQKSITDQGNIFDETIEQWKGGLEQTDDILVIGFKI
ncbi:MAG: protein serine/threonine phosphatase [Bacteroidetes bacterium]|nr:MAG: protein serine/threonine phosphatase [Bacteroidota bacterium]